MADQQLGRPFSQDLEIDYQSMDGQTYDRRNVHHLVRQVVKENIECIKQFQQVKTFNRTFNRIPKGKNISSQQAKCSWTETNKSNRFDGTPEAG